MQFFALFFQVCLAIMIIFSLGSHKEKMQFLSCTILYTVPTVQGRNKREVSGKRPSLVVVFFLFQKQMGKRRRFLERGETARA